MWTDTKGLTVIDLILEGTTATLNGTTITADGAEVQKIRGYLKNNGIESKYTIEARPVTATARQ